MDWIDDTAETWTYVNANKFKVTGDKTGQYPVGCKIRLKQGGSYKYFYVDHLGKDASFTYVSVNAGDDFSLANASITDNNHSYGETADGFPNNFGYTPTWTTTSGTAPTIGNGALGIIFQMMNDKVFLVWVLQVGTTTGVGNGGQWRFTAPVQRNDGWPMDKGQTYLADTGVSAYSGRILFDSASTFRPVTLLTNGTYAQEGGVTQTAPFSWGNTDLALGQAIYEVDCTVEAL